MAAILRPPVQSARTALKTGVRISHHIAQTRCQQRLKQIALHIDALDAETASIIAADAALTGRHQILTSIAGLGTLTTNQLIITMPELGTLDGKEAASLAELAPVARQSGQWKGKSFIRGGRANVRQAYFMPTLIAARFNSDLKSKYQLMVAAGKPAKVAIITANALLKADRLLAAITRLIITDTLACKIMIWAHPLRAVPPAQTASPFRLALFSM